MHSSSDAITQEVRTHDQQLHSVWMFWLEYTLSFLLLTPQFMDLRTRYTALVTLTTQHVKYISDALRRLEEEEVGLFLAQHMDSLCIILTCLLSNISKTRH